MKKDGGPEVELVPWQRTFSKVWRNCRWTVIQPRSSYARMYRQSFHPMYSENHALASRALARIRPLWQPPRLWCSVASLVNKPSLYLFYGRALFGEVERAGQLSYFVHITARCPFTHCARLVVTYFTSRSLSVSRLSLWWKMWRRLLWEGVEKVRSLPKGGATRRRLPSWSRFGNSFDCPRAFILVWWYVVDCSVYCVKVDTWW